MKFTSKILIVLILINIFSCKTQNKSKSLTNSITPEKYISSLGKGIDVDWAKTKQGITHYNKKSVTDFKKRGFSHVRIRVKDDVSPELISHLNIIVNDCLSEGIIPIIAYQGNNFKINPTTKNLEKIVNWWSAIASNFKEASPKVSFDILIEVTKALNKEPQKLNLLYEKVVSAIRKTNPNRILFISPRLRSNPEYLNDLAIPSKHNNFLLAEWHFYAAGPSKTNSKKLWITGSKNEKQIIRDKIKTALAWQEKTGILTWVGAWMPSDYNDGNHFSIKEQVAFANFVACELDNANIPFAINSDTKYYNRDSNTWIKKRTKVLNTILNPNCDK